MNLDSEVALVTGSAVGVGRSVALSLARRGMAVVVNYTKSEAEAKRTSEEVKAAGGRPLLQKADVSVDSQVRAMVDAAIREFGRIDYLVNNAGVTIRHPLADLDGLTAAMWHGLLDVNVIGAFQCARAVAPHMKRRGAGAIVNVSSFSGFSGKGSSIAYAASKAALNSLTKSLAAVLAPEIRVNAVAPGFIATRWNEGQEEGRKAAESQTPLGRVAGPDDIADTVVPLLVENRFVTGHIVVVDGGRSL